MTNSSCNARHDRNIEKGEGIANKWDVSLFSYFSPHRSPVLMLRFKVFCKKQDPIPWTAYFSSGPSSIFPSIASLQVLIWT